VCVSNSKERYIEIHSYKLNFHFTNNIVEYESLMLGLKLLKRIGAKRISIRGDSKLIIKHIKGDYFDKHPRLREYKNDVLDFFHYFIEYYLQVIPRGQNILAEFGRMQDKVKVFCDSQIAIHLARNIAYHCNNPPS
jgi:hypothetical protein